MKKLILASASPRRKEILSEIGASFEILVSDTDEACDLTDPADYVRELARRKGQAVAQALLEQGTDLTDTAILSADTVVVCDGTILGKPQDKADAIRMLTMLSGREHQVLTGIGVTLGNVTYTEAEATRVRVAKIPPEAIETYVNSGDPMDKAGSYGIQGSFSKWIDGIDGCYFNVVGLPAHRLNMLYHRCTGEYLGT
ncbi:MAG: septum formation protein Maf [Clostridia bacterium]|nr:septum formation protein Maf [Clostridia bacterium]